MQHFLKPATRTARAKVITAQFLVQQLVTVYHAYSTFYPGLGGVSLSSVCSTVQKHGAFSKPVIFLLMMHLRIFRVAAECEIVSSREVAIVSVVKLVAAPDVKTQLIASHALQSLESSPRL